MTETYTYRLLNGLRQLRHYRDELDIVIEGMERLWANAKADGRELNGTDDDLSDWLGDVDERYTVRLWTALHLNDVREDGLAADLADIIRQFIRDDVQVDAGSGCAVNTLTHRLVKLLDLIEGHPGLWIEKGFPIEETTIGLLDFVCSLKILRDQREQESKESETPTQNGDALHGAKNEEGALA